MEDIKSKQKNKEKENNNTKNSPQDESKFSLPENKLIMNKVNKTKSETQENEHNHVKSKFSNKINISKYEEIDDLNKSIKEDNFNKYILINNDKKIIQNSESQDFIEKIFEINNKESSFKNDSTNIFLNQREDSFSNDINSIKSNKIMANNNINIIKYKEEPKISNKKNGNNKIQKTLQNLKSKINTKEISKNKNNINDISKPGTQVFQKLKNIHFDSAISFSDRQNINENKYNSFITDNFKSHLKKADTPLSLRLINENNNNQQLTFRLLSEKNLAKIPFTQRPNLKINYNMSKRQKEIVQTIIDLDLNKLQKEIYEYENNDVTDAINKFPTHKFESDKNNDKKNENIKKHFKIKNKKDKKNKKCIKNIKERFRILRHVGYVYDSLDDEECEEEENNFYFEPNGNYILILDFVILLISVFGLIFLPIHLSKSPFNEKNFIKDFIFIFIDIVFIIDFISGFFKAYINFEEELIKYSVSIVLNYLKTWFLLDFLCGIPIYSILKTLKNKFENNNFYESYFFNYSGKNLFLLFEMVKLLKLIKAFKDNISEKKIERKIKKISFFYYWGRFIIQVFIFISILNLSSCLFIFSARNSYPNWILNSNMNINNFISIYICSFYYIITTMTTVGYGDIQIYSTTERIFEIFFLIIGTCLYSWMLTYVSNYIKKMNEKSEKFEKKLEILDNIKINYPLMSHDLYRKIYKLLYYKKYHQEIDKNIIIESLPYSIKNNLLTQMYYPIITNFKFFKYFGNSEFIIEIVSALRPFVSMKGDILINEGDYVEDIIFNKSGILQLDICIDLNNTYEFIEQYLIKYNLEKIKNKKNLDSSLKSTNYSKSSLNFNKMTNSTITPNNNLNFLTSIKDKKSNLEKEEIPKNKFQYLKIINIREKEHFGDVLMFLNEPSPLNVRVNSKNAEILLLNKTDVVKISSNFPNIWKRINEKSIFNLEQTKNLIMRKLSIFCFSNGIKIQPLYYKRDAKTGQNKINYSLIPIPDLTQEDKLNQNINLNENIDKISKNSGNNSSLNFENFSEKNTYIINEVQSSEESRTNNIFTKEIKNSNENITIPKKEASKKINGSINISNEKKFASDENTSNKRINNYCNQRMETRNQFLAHSRSYCNIHQRKNSFFSNKSSKNSRKITQFKNNTSSDNTNPNENYFLKNQRKIYLMNSHITNSSIISLPKRIPKNQNFAEKCKINKRLISTRSFNFMENYNNNFSNNKSDVINDEIYLNENFEIKIPDNDLNLIINNNINSQDNSNLNYPEPPKKLLIPAKKNLTINSVKEEVKNIDISDNLNSNNKFNNLKISISSTFEIKSSYYNINEFTKYKFISNESLIKKTKIFLSKECRLLYDINTKLNIPYHISIKNLKLRSKSSIKLWKYSHNKKPYDYINKVNNLSIITDNDINKSPPFSKELENFEFKRNKSDNGKFLENSLNNIRGLNKSFAHIKRNPTIRGEKILFNKGNSTCKNLYNNFSPKKLRRKSEISSENLVRIKTKNKLDLITKNLERDNQNLNNPNEFYADLFNNFYKQKIKKKESLIKIKTTKNDKVKDNSEEDKENSLDKN